MKIYAPTARAARCVECPRSNGAPDSAPADFDATANPIISRHWFGIEPFRPIGHVAADVVADLRRQRQVQKLHRLGPRALDALLIEIGAERGITTIIERRVERYAALDPKALKTLGGDCFPPLPIHEVQQP